MNRRKTLGALGAIAWPGIGRVRFDGKFVR